MGTKRRKAGAHSVEVGGKLWKIMELEGERQKNTVVNRRRVGD